jgi:DNA-binding CsgD family transcriptional regulator
MIEGTHRRLGATDPHLSPRQAQIVGMLADGMTGKETASRLGMSHESVRTHLRRAFEACRVNTSAGLVATAMRRGWIH